MQVFQSLLEVFHVTSFSLPENNYGEAKLVHRRYSKS